MAGNTAADMDHEVANITEALIAYRQNHPDAKMDMQRRHKFSIHIRIIDPDFEGMDRVDREPEVRKLLRTLDDETFQNITVIHLFAPSELERSFANLEFENPVTSRLSS